MGAILSASLGNQFNFENLGIPGTFGRSAYKAAHLYKMAGIDTESVVKKVKEFKLNQ